MFSFQKGRPIGVIKGGKFDKQILFVKDEKSEEKSKKKEEPDKLFNELLIDDNGKFYPIPNPDGRDILYAAGPSGSGKSTFVSNWCTEFKKIHENYKIYVFSRLGEDESIDKLKPIRIEINQEMLDFPIEPDSLKKSMVIFDDINTLPDKKFRDAVNALQNDLLETGRHQDIYVAMTNHLMTDYKNTRTMLNESHTIVFFPGSGAVKGIKYMLNNYIGLDKHQMRRILRLPSRWVAVKRGFPMLIMYEKGAYFLTGDD